MSKKIHEHFEEILPKYTYITNLEETELYTGLCAKHLDETQFKDVTDEEAEEIRKRIEEVDENEENDI